MLSCIQIATPEKSVFDMKVAAHMRFIAASLLPLSELLWAPTKITGTGVLSIMNAVAAAATARLSVPIPIMIPCSSFFT